MLPPTLCEEPNPELGIEKATLYVNTETRPWVHGKPHPRRAGVNAFGFGGINSHVVLEEYVPHRAADTFLRDWPCELIAVRGVSRAAVLEQARALRAGLAQQPEAGLRDIAFTVNDDSRFA